MCIIHQFNVQLKKETLKEQFCLFSLPVVLKAAIRNLLSLILQTPKSVILPGGLTVT